MCANYFRFQVLNCFLMAEAQDSNYNTNCDVNPRLQDLLQKKAIAKREVDFELEYVAPLQQASLEEAIDIASRDSDY